MLEASLSSLSPTNAAVRGQTQLLADFRTKRRHFFRPIFPVPTSIQRSLAHLFHNLSWLDDKALLLTCDLGKIATKEKNYNSKAKQKRPFFQMDRIWIKDIKKTGPRAANESTKSRDDPGQDYFQTFYSHRAAFHSTQEIQNCGTNPVLETKRKKLL